MMQIDPSQNTRDLNRAELLDILSWYVAAGVDEAVNDKTNNHFETIAPTPSFDNATNKTIVSAKTPLETNETTRSNEISRPNAKTASPIKPQKNKQTLAKNLRAGQVDYQHSIQLAQKTAARCDDLQSLNKALNGFEECSLKLTAKHLIFGQGNGDADLMLIGESPGRDEDMTGHAFAGANGQMLDQILNAIGFAREDVWLSYLLPWRSLGGVAPSAANVDICRPFLLRQIELVKPKIILTFDGLVCGELTKQTGSIITNRGKFTNIEINDHSYKAMPTFHPQLLLENPSYKQMVWQDFLSVKHNLNGKHSL